MTEASPSDTPSRRAYVRVKGDERAALAGLCRRKYESGMSLRAIRDVTGVSSASYVRRLIVEAGGVMRPKSVPWVPNPLPRHELAALLKRKYEAGASTTQLATSEVGSTRYVRRLLREAGTVIRPRGPYSRPKRKGTT